MGYDNTTKGIDTTSPYYLHPISTTDLIVSPMKLCGENYGEWARSIQNAFKGNNKLGFLNCTITEPSSTTSPDFSPWLICETILNVISRLETVLESMNLGDKFCLVNNIVTQWSPTVEHNDAIARSTDTKGEAVGFSLQARLMDMGLLLDVQWIGLAIQNGDGRGTKAHIGRGRGTPVAHVASRSTSTPSTQVPSGEGSHPSLSISND
ncbi:Retrovirus-related Pol polyprotein from transposon RE1 [Bienertia sinuspersici]